MFPRSQTLAAVATALLSSSAAAERPSHTIEVDACVDVPVSEVTRILHLELLDGPQGGSRSIHVRVGCEDDLIAVHLQDQETGWSLERRFQLEETIRGRARHLALEIAELTAVAFGRPGARRARRSTEERPDQRNAIRIGLAGMLEVRGTPSIVLGGGGLFVTHYWIPWLGAFFDGSLLSGGSDVDFGRIRATTGIATAGVFVDPTTGPVSLRLGLGARLESVWLSGQPATTDQITGLGHQGWSWSGLFRVRLDYALFDRVTFGLGVEAGWTAIPVRGLARGVEIVGIEGPWLRTSAAIALGFGG